MIVKFLKEITENNSMETIVSIGEVCEIEDFKETVEFNSIYDKEQIKTTFKIKKTGKECTLIDYEKDKIFTVIKECAPSCEHFSIT